MNLDKISNTLFIGYEFRLRLDMRFCPPITRQRDKISVGKEHKKMENIGNKEHK